LSSYLLLSRSITHAQRMCGELGKAGITTRLFRPPMTLSDRGCGYAVEIPAGALPSALERLRQKGLPPKRIFSSDGEGRYQEFTNW
jgi:hypothetical protein